MKRTGWYVVLFLFTALFVGEVSGGGYLRVTDLQCEYLSNAIGIDVDKPRLSWVIESHLRGKKQSAYQILVAGSEEKLRKDVGDMWDSAKVESDKSVHVVYGGKALESRMRCYWKVRVWDEKGEVSNYSDCGYWEMGLLEKKDWQAKWIRTTLPHEDSNKVEGSPYFRNEFELKKPVASARAYICGLGYYNLYLNGEKVGDHVLDPAVTRYDKRVLYVTHDVTDLVGEGKNAAGVVLGNGFYNIAVRAAWDFRESPWRDRPTVICQIEVRHPDGSKSTILTDSSWKVNSGPIVYNSIRNGVVYDARLEMAGWKKVGYDDGGWRQAKIVAGPKGKFKAQMMPPMKVIETLNPVKVTEVKPGVFVYDIGQNMSGRAQLRVSGPAGTKVTLKYGERLHEDGTVSQKGIDQHVKQGDFQTDTYIMKGEGVEVWEPCFVYHGFRYVEVRGFPGEASLENLLARVIHTSFDKCGFFECSNEQFNTIQKMTRWSYRSNFHGYPTDCPSREKLGWTGDAHLAAEQAMYNWCNAASYTKWMDDFKDEQRPTGALPGIVPTSGWGYRWGNGPAWDSAYILIPWYLYEYKGDERILAEHYEGHKRYVDYMTSISAGHIVDYGLGDWVPADTKTPEAVTSTGYYYADTVILARSAELLGKKEDAKRYGELAKEIRRRFNETFYKGDGIYANGSQTALSCAIYQGLVLEAEKIKVVEKLVEAIRKRNRHIDTGILGAKYLFRALSNNGRIDVAYKVATRETWPGYIYWIEQGATTLWESWKDTASMNHIMFGDISAWFYKYLAGIGFDSNEPGFKRIVIRPRPVGDLKWVEAEHECMYGTIRSCWWLSGEDFFLELSVPFNTTATVYLPTVDAESVSEQGRNVEELEGVSFFGEQEGRAVYEVGSGEYVFSCKYKKESNEP